MQSVRCFVAIPLPESVKQPLLDACGAIRDSDDRWRAQKWVSPDNLHVTLKFLGSIPADEIDPLRDALGEAFASAGPFELPFSGLRPVPNRRRATMLWATFLDPEGAAASLAARADRAALPFGVAPEERMFKPHVTLVRARRPRSLHAESLLAAEQALHAIPEIMSVRDVTFVSSQLTSKQPVYTELASWDLTGG